MGDSIAVSVKNVSKKFRLFGSPKERLWEALHPFNKKYHREFWALKDISFEVPKGKTLGIIGRNGSGKSTLLQVICSVLRPTLGTVAVNGRISALLELGTGFNPEFTGRENALLNGALMGFSRAEMQERLPLIESFADIGEFIDQPVKTYSSGMFVRLAFAAAINVDPDILIVDEALAVGDAKFQHKCYQKFIEFQEAGKTIILVTHNTDAVVRHCDYAILVENGEILEMGEPKLITNYYIDLLFTGKISNRQLVDDPRNQSTQSSEPKTKKTETEIELKKFLEEVPAKDRCIYRKSYNKNEYRYGDKRAEIVDYFIVTEKGCDVIDIRSGETLDIYVKIKYYDDIALPATGFAIKSIDGILINGTNTIMKKIKLSPVSKDSLCVFQWRVKISLVSGDYFIDFGCGDYRGGISFPLDIRYGLAHISVQSHDERSGFVYLDTEFSESLRSPFNEK